MLRRTRIAAAVVVAQPEAELPPPAPAAAISPKVSFGRCVLDIDGRRLLTGDGEEVPVTAMEFDLLEVFAANPDRVLSRDRLLDLAHHRGLEPFDRSIDIRVWRLRRKIERDPRRPEIIKTVRGGG